MQKIILFVFIISFSACATYYTVDIDILSPSGYQIPSSTQKIILLNNATEQAPNIGHTTFRQIINYTPNASKKKVSTDNIKVDSTTTTALYTAYNLINESKLFSTIEIGRKKAIPHITKENIKLAFDKYPADALIVLEKLTYKDNLTHSYYEYYEIEEQEVEVITNSVWSLYYKNDNTQYSFSTKDTLYWRANNLNRANCVQEGVWNNAKRSAEQIVPHWLSAKRFYYTGKSLIYEKIDKDIKVQAWSDAAETWMSIYNSEKKNTQTKAKMAFNMALFFETQSDINTALMWLETASKIFKEKEATDNLNICLRYVVILNNRLNDQRKLDLQFAH